MRTKIETDDNSIFIIMLYVVMVSFVFGILYQSVIRFIESMILFTSFAVIILVVRMFQSG